MTEMQMEFWMPALRKNGKPHPINGEWIPQHLTQGLTGFSKAWRKVFPGHKHKDRLAHSIATVRSCGYSRDRARVCDEYIAWARSKCLTRVSTYRDDRISNFAARGYGSLRNEVEVSEFIGPAPVAEYDAGVDDIAP